MTTLAATYEPSASSARMMIGLVLVGLALLGVSLMGTTVMPDGTAVHIVLGLIGASGAAFVAREHFVEDTDHAVRRFADVGLAAGMAFMAVYTFSQLGSESRADHQISETRYSALATIVRTRPDAADLLAPARADGVVTNGEYDQFVADLARSDRRLVVGR